MRLVVDLSSMVRWLGPPVGLVRVQRHYAAAAAAFKASEVAFTVFDPIERVLRQVSPNMAAEIIAGDISCDMSFYPDPARFKTRFYDRWPNWARRSLMAIIRPRRILIMEIGAFGLRNPGSPLLRFLERIENRLMKETERRQVAGVGGSRARIVPLRTVAGNKYDLSPGDHLLLMNNDWAHTDIEVISREARLAGAKLIVLLNDIIPIQFPEWYKPHDVKRFTDYVDLAMRLADRFILTSRRVTTDVVEYAAKRGIHLPQLEHVPLGCDSARKSKADGRLADGLEMDRYVLFVSTIEPRKNHSLLMDVWTRLVLDGTVARSGMKLVFVGRSGWMVEGILAKLHGHPAYGKSLVHLDNVDDGTLSLLYRNSAFCVYPSLYEGYGLPPVEALAYGKALIASTGGAIAEVVGSSGLCLDPLDIEGWENAMREWITSPAARAPYEAKAADFVARSWGQAGRETLEATLAPFPDEIQPPPG
ncbi:glycosyltransferase family 4 protein [Mesorhizobium sp. CA18]|uniref:glycosyltransferase family 4 protein n=1 Tax=unclassified Mesorhizobium TaxID=325217 RepID=UPI001CCF6060|nr:MULTISPECIES: glycosyltransferase family 1 protein [unclassified Mesorhizobium]MBZ9734872.1 glycosyltransferase family 4 protein [Mesorhizobium sp. CA9]MBZ9827171.1 glycosyltransferase family 4 protein [Mesorhizobium sp. CA18]MBZ9832615.1 glycosyltransferase family 4 protein [Mesorhizobium sp. CA2]MBZ9838639.1 glycosyltransferase family 4 protein [Mesorhizobium sp. CA3]MBZ9879247.1 glycosyltransferase family 4 protein [Mesorhizobium sp. Ca11]